jgi:hypothetical protein
MVPGKGPSLGRSVLEIAGLVFSQSLSHDVLLPFIPGMFKSGTAGDYSSQPPLTLITQARRSAKLAQSKSYSNWATCFPIECGRPVRSFAGEGLLVRTWFYARASE